MTLWSNDDELFALTRRELYSEVVGDVMDKLGLLHQFLPPQVRPLRDDMFIVGRAMPVLESDWSDDNPPSGYDRLVNKPFGLMLEALDELTRNEIYVCTGASPHYALWGELMSAAAMHRGAVVDGYSRDTRGIVTLVCAGPGSTRKSG